MTTRDLIGLAEVAIAGALHDTLVRGKILSPGVWHPLVQNPKTGHMEPGTLHIGPDVILEAYAQLKEDVAAGRVDMQLTHPDAGGMPLRWGIVRAVKVDPARGEVWLDKSEVLPSMQDVLTSEAVDKLQSLGLSVRARFRSVPIEGRVMEFRVTRMRIDGVDIVREGASPGSDIVPGLPAGLLARFTGTHAKSPGTAGARASAKELRTMAEMTMDTLPEDVKKLPPSAHAKYVEAYNAAAKEENRSPEDAHKMAFEAASQFAASAEKDAGIMKAQLAARDTRVSELERTNRDLEQKLAAKNGEAQTLEARVAATESQLQKMVAERAETEAVHDVDAAVRAGKILPAERDVQLRARRALGHDLFTEQVSLRPVLVMPGEKGNAQPQNPQAPEDEKVARADIQKFGVDGVFRAGLHKQHVMGSETLREVLMAEHADHPLVRKNYGGELAARATAARTKATRKDGES